MQPQEIEVTDISKSAWAYVRKHYWGWVALIILGVIFVAYEAISSRDPHMLQLAIFSLAAFGGLYAYAFSKMKHLFMQEFASSIGFSYSLTLEPASLKGRLFALGHSARCDDVLSGSYKGFPMRIFNYYFTVGYGKHQRTFSFTVFELRFKARLPEIFLISKSERADLFGSSLGAGESVRLEGDFNKYFDLYVPKGSEQEAYEIFTPDSMATLIDKANNLDFQFIEDRLYVYEGKIIETRPEMQATFALVDSLVDMMQDEIQEV